VFNGISINRTVQEDEKIRVGAPLGASERGDNVYHAER